MDFEAAAEFAAAFEDTRTASAAGAAEVVLVSAFACFSPFDLPLLSASRFARASAFEATVEASDG